MSSSDIRALAVEVDTLLAALHTAAHHHEQQLRHLADSLHRAAEHARTGVNILGATTWDAPLTDAITTVEERIAAGQVHLQWTLTDYRTQSEILTQIRVEASEANAIWLEHQWTRAFLVTNAGGHVHSSMECSTCRPTTTYEWLTEYSAANEDDIVAAAGELACTICYPSAPADILNQPATIQSAHRAQAAAEATQCADARAQRDAARRAKAPTASGEPLRVPSRYRGDRWEEIRTERTAISTWMDTHSDLTGQFYPAREEDIPHLQRIEELIEVALADKHGTTPQQQREILLAKYAKRRS